MAQSTSDSLSSIRHVYECSICLEVLRDPKTLECEHSFCKECLEECVELSSPVPTILCPTCRDTTKLVDTGTVSELKAQLVLRQILDGMEECKERYDAFRKRCDSLEGKLSPRCCNLTMEWYCCNCKSYFCKKCFNVHSLLSPCAVEFYEIKYNESFDSFSPFCDRHNAFHRYGCLRCASTFCNYCKVEHNKSEECIIVSFKDYGKKFKDPLLQKIALMKDFMSQQANVLDDINNPTVSIQSQDDILKKAIEERKIIILSQVMFLLQLAGYQVQSNFDNKIKEFESAKQKLKDEIESKLNSVDEVLKKSEDLANSNLMEVISQVIDIENDFHSVLPGDGRENHFQVPVVHVDKETETAVNFMDSLFNAVQLGFGCLQLETMKDDGSFELTKMLNTNCNDIGCTSTMFSKLTTISESRKYIRKSMKQLNSDNMDSKPDDNGDQISQPTDDNEKEKKEFQKKKKGSGEQENVVSVLCHDHPLRLSPRKKWTCQVCGNNFEATKSYFCGNCKYDVCCECVSVIGADDNGDQVSQSTDDIKKEKKKSQKKKKGSSETQHDIDRAELADDNGDLVSQPTDDIKKEKKKSWKKKKGSSKTTEADLNACSDDHDCEPDSSDAAKNKVPGQSKFTVHLASLPYTVTKSEIYGLFRGLKVGNVRMLTDRATLKCNGCAYVDFFEYEQLCSALALNGQKIRDRAIKISIGQPRTSVSQGDREASETSELDESGSGSESDDENESTTDGGDRSQRRGRGGRYRGRGNKTRGERGRHAGRGGASRGNRGGPPAMQRGRGTPHQRPTPSSSFPSLTICYKCGAMGHVVSACPQIP